MGRLGATPHLLSGLPIDFILCIKRAASEHTASGVGQLIQRQWAP